MERTTIINELRKFEIEEERYNGRSIDEVGNYKLYLEDSMNFFFDDLRLFRANKEKDTVSEYISQTLSDLEIEEQQLESRYKTYCEEHKGEDLCLVDTFVALQKKYTQQMRNRLEDALSGKKLDERKAVIHKNEIGKVAYEALLSEYGDLLSTQDLVRIFNVTRQTIHNWEIEGKIHRSNSQSRKPLYLKSDIKAYLIQNNPDLVQVHREELDRK